MGSDPSLARPGLGRISLSRISVGPDDQQPRTRNHEPDVQNHPDRRDIEAGDLTSDEKGRADNLGQATQSPESYTTDPNRCRIAPRPVRLHESPDIYDCGQC